MKQSELGHPCVFCPSLWTTHLFVAGIKIRTITAQITDLEKEVDEKELLVIMAKQGQIHDHKLLLVVIGPIGRELIVAEPVAAEPIFF